MKPRNPMEKLKYHENDGFQQDVDLERVASLLRMTVPSGPPEEETDPEIISQVVDGSTPELLRDMDLAILSSVASVDRLVQNIPAEPLRKKRLRTGFVASALAAAIGTFMLTSPDTNVAPQTHRADVISSAASPTPLAPLGPEFHRTLTWTEVPSARVYAVQLFDTNGVLIFSANTTEETLIVPDTTRLQAGSSFFWQVKAQVGMNRWIESDLVEFGTLPNPGDER